MKSTYWAFAAFSVIFAQTSFGADLQNGMNANGSAKCCTSGTCLNLPPCVSQNSSDLKIGKASLEIPGAKNSGEKTIRAIENP